MAQANWIKSRNGKTRARGLGLALPGTPGPFNAITDVAGVEVGVTTLISGDGKLVVGQGPIRTGVTAILPRGKAGVSIPCAAGTYSLNGNGEMTGTIWIEESGELQTPIAITNTHSCGIARDAILEWMVKRGFHMGQEWGLPVAAETSDSELNDMNGFHVKPEHVLAALDGATSGPVEFGSIGGGTGMLCYDFKGGNGSSSRRVGEWTLGVFAQTNFGQRPECTILGVPVGRHLQGGEIRGKPAGSVIVIVATDAPLQAHQLKRLARRVPLGLARTGAIGHGTSGDIFLAFSTANADAFAGKSRTMDVYGNDELNPFFQATVEATEEAVIDSMIANEGMVGRDGTTAIALPHDRLLSVMKQYGRMG